MATVHSVRIYLLVAPATTYSTIVSLMRDASPMPEYPGRLGA